MYIKAIALFNLGKTSEAVNCVTAALNISPDYVPALLVKAKVSLGEKDFTTAANCSDSVLAKDSNNTEALILKSVALSGLGKYEDAKKISDSLIARDVGNATAWYNKACFESRLGNSDEAILSLTKATQLDRRYIEQAKTEEDFEPLRNDARFQKLIETKNVS